MIRLWLVVDVRVQAGSPSDTVGQRACCCKRPHAYVWCITYAEGVELAKLFSELGCHLERL